MNICIHFPDHEWYSEVLKETVKIDFCYCDHKSGFVIPTGPLGDFDKFDFYFHAGHTFDKWEEADFGNECGDQYNIDKFFGQEVPIYMTGYLGETNGGGEPILPNMVHGVMNEEVIVYHSEEEFWEKVQAHVEKALSLVEIK